MLHSLLRHGSYDFRATGLGSGPRFAYNEPATDGTSEGEETVAERGWKFVLPMNQYRAHLRLQRVYLRALVQFSCLLELWVIEWFSTLSFSILHEAMNNMASDVFTMRSN